MLMIILNRIFFDIEGGFSFFNYLISKGFFNMKKNIFAVALVAAGLLSSMPASANLMPGYNYFSGSTEMSWAWSEVVSPISPVTGVENIEYIFSVHLDTPTSDYLAVTTPFSYTASPVAMFTQLSTPTSILSSYDFSYDVKGSWTPSTSVVPYAALFAVSGKIGEHEVTILDGYCTNKKGDTIGTPTQAACEEDNKPGNDKNNHIWHAAVITDTMGDNQLVTQTFTNLIPCFGVNCATIAAADQPNVSNVPEPAPIAFLTIGLLGMSAARRKIFKLKPYKPVLHQDSHFRLS
jgi:hypothetical protein